MCSQFCPVPPRGFFQFLINVPLPPDRYFFIEYLYNLYCDIGTINSDLLRIDLIKYLPNAMTLVVLTGEDLSHFNLIVSNLK